MKILAIILTAVLTATMASNASAGFLDTFNKATQAVQNTANSVENAKRTAERVGVKLPAKKEAASPAEKITAPQTTGTLTPKDRTAIEKAKRAWVAAFKSEDWEAMADQYAEDAVVLPPDEEALSGREAIIAYFTDDADTSNEDFDTIDISGDSNIAYVQGTFSFDIAEHKGGPTVKAAGKYIEIWQKQEDGTWLITHDIWNADPVE